MDKVIKIVIDYVSDYVFYFFNVIKNPKVWFKPVEKVRDETTEDSAYNLTLNPKLLLFTLFNLIVGTSLIRLLIESPKSEDFLSTFTVILFLWGAFSIIIFLISRAFGGKGDFIETLTLCLQVFGVVYVLTSLLSVILYPTVFSKIEAKLEQNNIDSFISNPIIHYFTLQSLLFIIYVIIGVNKLHKFKYKIQPILVGVLSTVLWIYLNYSIFSVLGFGPAVPLNKEKLLIVDLSGSMRCENAVDLLPYELSEEKFSGLLLATQGAPNYRINNPNYPNLYQLLMRHSCGGSEDMEGVKKKLEDLVAIDEVYFISDFDWEVIPSQRKLKAKSVIVYLPNFSRQERIVIENNIKKLIIPEELIIKPMNKNSG